MSREESSASEHLRKVTDCSDELARGVDLKMEAHGTVVSMSCNSLLLPASACNPIAEILLNGDIIPGYTSVWGKATPHERTCPLC